MGEFRRVKLDGFNTFKPSSMVERATGGKGDDCAGLRYIISHFFAFSSSPICLNWSDRDEMSCTIVSSCPASVPSSRNQMLRGLSSDYLVSYS